MENEITKQEAIKAITKLFEDKGIDVLELRGSASMVYEDCNVGICVYHVSYLNDELSIDGVKLQKFTKYSIQCLYETCKSAIFMKVNGDYTRKFLELGESLRKSIKRMAGDQKFKLTKYEAPMMYYNEGWCSIIELQSFDEDSRLSPVVGWHDETCTNKGANVRIGLGNCPMEVQVELFEILCRKLNK